MRQGHRDPHNENLVTVPVEELHVLHTMVHRKTWFTIIVRPTILRAYVGVHCHYQFFRLTKWLEQANRDRPTPQNKYHTRPTIRLSYIHEKCSVSFNRSRVKTWTKTHNIRTL